MGVLNKNQKTKLNFIDNDDTDSKTAKNLNELNKSGRGAKKKGKVGRPKMDESKKQTKRPLLIQLSDEQKAKLEEKAKKANLSMNAYIIVKLFGVD